MSERDVTIEVVTYRDGHHEEHTPNDIGAMQANSSSLDYPRAGTLHGTSGSLVDHDGGYESRMYWGPDSYFDGNWVAVASVGPSPYEDHQAGYIIWNREKYNVRDYYVFHERGHNLGYRHGDGGIMSYDPSDIDSDGIHDTTRAIAENSEGLHLLEWSDARSAVLKRGYSAWKKGHITVSDLRYLFAKWKGKADGTEMYSSKYIETQMVGLENWGKEMWTGGLYRDANAYASGTKAWR